MHPYVTELIERRAATGWPSKRGVQASDQAFDTAEFLTQYISEWAQAGVHCVKLMASGDSQINTIIAANKLNWTPIWIVRFYGNNAPDDVIAPDMVKPYVDRGVHLFECTANEFYQEYENKWGKSGQPMPRDWSKQIAHQFARQADSILQAGGVPITPAIESWKFCDYFMPLFNELCANYASLLKQSIMGGHNRTLNHPPEYDKDPGCYRGWEDMDDYVYKRLGEHMPYIATEAGPEPLWDDDRTYPPVSLEMHAAWVKQILAWPTPSHYLFDCLWIWKGRGGFERASYKDNPLVPNRGDLPVVVMLKSWRLEAGPAVLTDDNIRQIGERRPSEISLNPAAALYRAGQAAGLGQAETSEWDDLGWRWQKFERGIVCCPIGQWDKVRTVRRGDA
jgi:hypothetical protein